MRRELPENSQKNGVFCLGATTLGNSDNLQQTARIPFFLETT